MCYQQTMQKIYMIRTENAIVETVSHVLTVVAKKISLWFSCLWVDRESRISGVYIYKAVQE